MKILSYFAGFVFLTICSSVSAIPIFTTGGADTIVDYGTIKPSSSHAENQFIADYLGVDVSIVNYSQLPASGGEDGVWTQVNEDPDLWAFDFGTKVDLFIIKVGKNVGLVSDGTSDTFTHFLYENFNQYGVIDLGVFDRIKGNVEILMVSHVGTHVGTTVPEPSIVALLGIGLLGMTFIRRRIIK